MKILLLLLIIIIVVTSCSRFYFREKRSSVIYYVYGPFTITMETISNRRSYYFRIVTETSMTYTVWYKGKKVSYPGRKDDTGYAYMWEVYLLEKAPTPTLIAGSGRLFLIKEENGSAVILPLNAQSIENPSLQFLDSANDAPGEELIVYQNMTNKARQIKTLKGGDYLLVDKQSILHIPTLKTEMCIAQNQKIDGYFFVKTGGAQAFSPDKKKLVFLGSKINNDLTYEKGMIVYDVISKKATVLSYNHTQTRSNNFDFNDRGWFRTYFEWTRDDCNDYNLQLRKYDVLPFWKGYFKFDFREYELSPVSPGMEKVLIHFILSHLGLPGEEKDTKIEYLPNNTIIPYKDWKLSITMEKEASKLVVMMKDAYFPEDQDKLNLLRQIGEAFNKELEAGKYQKYFTQF